MIPVHALLFDHAVNSLKAYKAQSPKEKDIVLIKDAQVAMSCVLNTMSKWACEHFRQSKEEAQLETAKSLSIIADFEDHPCLQYLRNYIDVLCEKGVIYLKKKVAADRGIINGKYLDEVMPADVSIEDKVLRVIEYL
ncbi:hypothetical protein BGZ76_007391 [Entomortierella beljakovae]|nr:hypothetical protein BGZ76_007391 [Entomortierella beljakovae]